MHDELQRPNFKFHLILTGEKKKVDFFHEEPLKMQILMHPTLSTLPGKKYFIILRRLWQVNYEKAGYEVITILVTFYYP